MIYVDTHHELKVSPETVDKINRSIASGQRDQYGVKPLNFLYNDKGRAFCIADAPSAEAVRKEHEAMGAICEEITAVNCLKC